MIKQDVYDEVQGLEPLCQEICHTLWNHPELSGNERESANFLRKILSEEGFTIENNEHLEHAFNCRIRKRETSYRNSWRIRCTSWIITKSRY